jgi:hypothetical protein
MKLSRVEIPKVVGKIINHFNTIIFSICPKEFFMNLIHFMILFQKCQEKKIMLKSELLRVLAHF